MRWWTLFVVPVIWSSVSSQQIKEQDVHGQQKTVECCPCTDQNSSGNSVRASLALPDSDASDTGASLAFSEQDAPGNGAPLAFSDSDASGNGARASLAGLGECPCQLRDADPMGSSSVFFPTAVRAVRPFVSLEDAKEDSKPLLQPEVGLASSVLETLREATEEEYEDALARDAARSAVASLDQDGVAEESRNIVTVVVSPKQDEEDVVTGASDTQETRCVNPPLARSNSLRTPSLGDILNLPRRQPLRNLLDTDSNIAASNTNEQIVSSSNGLGALKLKSGLDLSNLFSKTKNAESPQIFGLGIRNSNEHINGQAKAKVPNILNFSPKIDTSKILRNDETNDNNIEIDNEPSTSNTVERYSGFSEDNNDDSNTGTLEISDADNDSSSTLPTGLLIPKIEIPNMRLTSKSRDSTSNFLNSFLKNLAPPKLNDMFSTTKPNINGKAVTKGPDSEDIQFKDTFTTPENKTFETEILDTVPGASMIEAKQIVSPKIECQNKDDIIEREEQEALENYLNRKNVETEIIDSLPNESEMDSIAEISEEDNERNLPNSEEIEFDDTQLITDSTSQNGIPENDSSFILNNIPLDQENDDLDNTENEFISDITEFDREGLKTVRSDVDSMTDSSDQTSTGSLEDKNTRNVDVETQFEKPCKENESMLNKSKLTLRERLLERLENIKSPKLLKSDSKRVKNIDDPDKTTLRNEDEKEEEHNKSIVVNSSTLATTKERSDKNISELSMDELQEMSDSLLSQEKKLVEAMTKLREKTVDPNLDLESPQNKNSDSMSANEAADFNKNVSNEDIAEPTTSESKSISQISDVSMREDSSCLSNFPIDKKISEKKEEPEHDEMALGASETVESRNNLKSTLLPGIVQPSPLTFGSDLNLFNRPPLNNANIFNHPLPIIGSRNMFDSAESGNSFQTASFDGNNNWENVDEGMSTLESKPNSRLALPTFKPLEDINLDIFQLNPLTLTKNSLLPPLPRLNLNKYKARLALPKTLQLKPVVLESSVGNKKGIIGASLTFGPEKKQKSFRTTDIFGSSLGNLPTLDNLGETMVENAQNLLNTPLDLSSRNMLEDTLRSTQVLSENLRVQADNTVKNLHKNLESTLNGASMSNIEILGNPLHTSDLLESVARRHEDLGDKLKGIHTDLTDRLESFRNNIADQLPTLGSSMNSQSSTLNILSQRPVSFSSKPRSKGTIHKKTNKKPAQGKFKFSTPRSSSNKNKFPKMPTAASISTPKVVEPPKLKSIFKDPPVLKTTRNEPVISPPVFPEDSKFLDLFEKSRNAIGHKKSVLGSALRPKFRENKVTITFGTTTLPPHLKTKPVARNPNFKSMKTREPLSSVAQKPPSRGNTLPGSKLKSFRDANVLPSEIRPTVVKAPLRQPSKLKAAPVEMEEGISTSTIRPALALPTMKPKPPVLRKTLQDGRIRSGDISFKPKNSLVSDDKIAKVDTEQARSLASLKKPTLSWPKAADDKFLSKVREALKARLAEIGSKRAKSLEPKVGKTDIPQDVDMLRSASNNVDTINLDSKLMKENQSYTCKMMCTKN